MPTGAPAEGDPIRGAETWPCPGLSDKTVTEIPFGPTVLSVRVRENKQVPSVPGHIG